MKKLLSIILALAMILSTLIIPTAIVVGAEDITVLTKEYYVSNGGNDETGDGSQENPFATINKAQSVAAALENETTVVNATFYLTDITPANSTDEEKADNLQFDGGVAHKGMFTLKGLNGAVYIDLLTNVKHYAAKRDYGSFTTLLGPTTFDTVQFEDLKTSSYAYLLNGGHEVVYKNLTSLDWKQYGYYFGAVDGVGIDDVQKVTLDNIGGAHGTTLSVNFGLFYSTPDQPVVETAGVDFVINGGSMTDLRFLKDTAYKGNVNVTINNFRKRGDQTTASFTSESTFNGAFQMIINNNKYSIYNDANRAAIEAVQAAKGSWVMYGKSTNGTLTTTETAGTFKVNSTGIAQAQNKATGEVFFSENGYLTVPAGVYDFSFGGPAALYVSETGSDETGDGTEANPYATVNKAIGIMANNIFGTIYVSGKITDPVLPAAHVGMITIEGLEGTNPTIQYGYDMNPNGPLTIKDVVVAQNGNHPVTNGHEFIIDIKKGSETNTVAYYLGNVNNTATSFTNEKMTVVRNEYGWIYGPTKFELGKGTYTGGIDLLIENSHTYWISINNSTFKGDVNITIDAFTQRSDEGFYREIFAEGATLEKALQVIYNNNSAANIKTTKVFETEAATAAGGKWVIYGDNSGGKLRTTETAGTFKVIGPATAIATNAAGTEVISEGGLLKLDAGVWNVTYDYRVVYVSETGSDETGDGTEANPFATIKKAMPLLGNKAGTIYVKGNVVIGDVAHTGMITIKGYDDNSAIEIKGPWGNQIFDAFRLSGPMTLEDLRIIFTHKIVTQGQALHIKDCWTTGNPYILVGHYQQNKHTTGNELKIDGLKFMNEKNLANSAPWTGLTLRLGSFGDSVNYNTNDINISLKNTNLKVIDMSTCKGTIKGDVKIAVDSSVHLTTDGAYWTSIDDSAVEGNFEFISNGKGTKAFTGITASDTDLTHVAVTEGNGIWFLNGAAGDKLETTDVAGTYNVVGGKVATATNGTDTISSVNGVLTLPAGTWDISYDMKDFYVSETGSDETGDGTKANPYKTVDKALASVGNKEGATIYVSGTVSLRYDTARTNMVTITGLNGTEDIVAAGWGNTANAGCANPFKGPITFKDVSIKGNGQYWVSNGKDVVFDNVSLTNAAHMFFVGNAEATQRDENVVVNNAGTKSFPLSYYFGTFGTSTKTGKVNFEFNGGTFHSLRFYGGTFADDVNIVVNNFTPRKDDGEWQLILEKPTTFEKALQVIFNNNTYGAKAPKYDQWADITAAGGKWIMKSGNGGTLALTDVAGKFEVTTTNNFVAIAYDESGKAVATSENGILDLSKAEGVYTVAYVDGSVLLDAIYVSATEGNDSNIGSKEAPVATLKVAIQKVKALTTEEKVIYIMGTVPTLSDVVNNKTNDYVTYSEMITFKGYDENSALEFTTTWKNQVNQTYMFQGPTTLEGLRLIVNGDRSIMTNGNEVVINDCYMNTSLTFYVGDHEKSEANAKVNKLTVNGLEFFNDTFTAEAPWLGLNMYYGAFGGDAAQVESGAAAKFATAGVEVYINGTNLKAFRFDRSRGYISGDVKLTVDKAFTVPLSQGGYQTQVGSIKEGVLVQPNVIKGAYSVVVNNNVGTKVVTGTYENAAINNLSMINAEEGEYFVYSADINGNTMAIGDAAGEFDIVSDYSVDVKDAEGNVVTRASDVLDVEAGAYYVTYFNAADINADGKLDIRDLVAFKNEFANAETKNYAQFDISLDGSVNSEDLASFQKYFLNVIEIKFAPVGDDLAFTYFEDAVLMSDDMAEEYKAEIYREDVSNMPSNVLGGTYYVSSLKTNSQNLGTEEHPFTSIEALNAAFADKVNDEAVLNQIVLFERGSVFRTSESLVLDSKTYYGAYGEGEKPQILGSLRDYADASLWTTENGGSIWQLQLPELAEDEEGSNIVVTKNGVEGIAKRVNSLASVDTTGEYYYDDETGIIYLYCDFINPAKYFDSIEISTTNAIVRNYDIKTPTDRVYNDEFIVENLCIKFAGIHTFALSDVNDSVIQYCEVGWAGGHSTASDGERYGNGIEIWNRAENVTIANNYIYQCYDAAVTFQGSAINQYNNVAYENNLIERCSFGFEFWAGTGLELKEIPEDATEEEIAAIEAENAEIQAQIDAKYAAAVMTEIYFQNNVMRLAAGGMGGACRSNLNTYKYQSFIQPFNFDASKLLAENVDVNIIGNVFDTSYRSFVWGTAEDDAGNYVTIDALIFEGNYYVQNTSIAPNVSLINGEVCETFADFEEAVYALDESAELVEWYQ